MFLASLFLLSLGPAQVSAALERQALTGALYRAQRDVVSSETYANLLMSSSQAALTRLQWSFGRWGLKDRKMGAAADFARISEKIEKFRAISSQVSSVTDPLAPVRAQLSQSPAVREAAAEMPVSLSEQIRELEAMRKAYDADASRSALIRATRALDDLHAHIGPSRLKKSQERVLLLARDILHDIAATRKHIEEALPDPEKDLNGAHSKGRSLVHENLRQLQEDVQDLSAEVGRLEIRFRLDNYLMDDLK